MNKSYHGLWQKRSLIYNFAITDLKIRYRNSILGFFWTVLEPLLLLGVLYLVFTNIFKSQIEHYGLYLLLGIIMWNTFTRGTEISLNSVTSRTGIVTQIYFPREIPAISSTITAFLMMCFEFVVFGIFMAIFKFVPPLTILLLPLVLLLEFFLVLGFSLPLSVLNVRYRDMQFIWKVFVQVGFFITPIFYKIDILPESIRKALTYSPLVQIFNIAHDVTIYNSVPSQSSIEFAIITTGIVLAVGYGTFKKIQKRAIEDL